ncbi:hypothetical protein KUW00_15590 [Halomonas sp. DP5N14-9]|uniref:hypothetical protein n=1 Tax=Halomonas sp. DP5N14-9 TaxID=2859075 RepID=UPI001C993DDC|nr:hypothetical protein [Halomonas sp. DP5N14-9]MBY5942302.1 hypothetical protein [Halomonas sp. DP5N14-9]
MSSEIEGQAIIEVTEEVTIIETSADINSPIYAEEAKASAAEAKASEVSAAEDAAATAADRVQTGLDRQASSQSASDALASEQAAKASENAADQDAQATSADRAYIDGQVDHVDSQVAHVDSQVDHVDSQVTFVDQRATDADASATAAAASETAAAGSAASADADATQTADDRRQTGEDRVQTGLDRTAASDSATAAADSATLADQHRQAAAASEANAAQSESDAQDHLNAFLDRYYGDYATPPAVSPTGNAPGVGDLYFDTTEGALKIWTSAGWRNATTVVEGVYDVHEYRNQEGSDTFTLDYDVGLLQVLYNGVQLASDDFTADNGTSVTLAQPVTKATDVITLIRWGAVTQATFIGTAAQKDVEDFDPAGAAAQAEANAKSYTDMELASLVASAPGALDTLNELAQALGDDPNFATTMTNALGQKLDASAYTAADVLAKLLTVDGAGTGLNADLVDGAHAADLRNRSTHTGTQPLSTLSDAGTAASRDVGTGTDNLPTADTVGDWLHTNTISDLHVGMSQNFVSFDGANIGGGPANDWTNGFKSTHANYLHSYLINQHRTNHWWLGWYDSQQDAGSGNSVAWAKILHSLNSVGYVDSDSVSVMEYGGNANGNYLKLKDGTLICWKVVSGTFESPSGEPAESPTSWAATFAYPDYIVLPHFDTPIGRYIHTSTYKYTSNNSTVRFTLKDDDGTNINSYDMMLLAVGRWK